MAGLYKLLAVQYDTICSYYMHAGNRVHRITLDRMWI